MSKEISIFAVVFNGAVFQALAKVEVRGWEGLISVETKVREISPSTAAKLMVALGNIPESVPMPVLEEETCRCCSMGNQVVFR